MCSTKTVVFCETRPSPLVEVDQAPYLRISSLHAYCPHHMPTCLSTSVHYKPTDSHNYLLHSSSHPQHVENAIPFSEFLRLRRLCSVDTNFNNNCEEMCQFFKKRGYPDSAVTTGKHRAQEIDRETALQTSQNEETDRIPFTLTYHPQNLAIKMSFSKSSPQ